MSNSARCDLIADGTILKLYGMRPKSNSNCQKQITITPNQFHLKVTGIKGLRDQKIIKRRRNPGANFVSQRLLQLVRLLVWLLLVKLKTVKMVKLPQRI